MESINKPKQTNKTDSETETKGIVTRREEGGDQNVKGIKMSNHYIVYQKNEYNSYNIVYTIYLN